MSERDQVLRQIDRLIASPVLHGSESLCKLLRYLAKHALDHPGEPLKEYKIATEEFGRAPDFDAQLDSMVRVQAGRLRGKLAEYYASEGAEDHIRVELPKGTYLLSFQHRAANHAKTGAHITPTRDELHPGEHRPSRGWLATVIVLSALLVLSVLALYNTRRTISTAPETKPAAAALQTFWKPFLDRPEEPLIVFSNAAFVGRPETGMRYYNPGHDSRDSIWDHYTGVGEVLAVHNLDQVFASLHRNIRVKRGSLFSLDDAKNNDLIFVGSPSENLTLLEIPGTQEFVFQRVDSGTRKGDLAVVNVHPQAEEAKEYLASSSTSPLTEDYAVVALLHGLNPGRFVMIVAGTTTFGTQGAIEYVCRQNSIEELLLRLSVSQTGELQPFEALLRVKVTRGVPVETQLVSLRKITGR
jgi:hypothetical protein